MKVRLGARVDGRLADRIDGLVGRVAGTRTVVIEKVLEVGLGLLEVQVLADGFALLADSEMYDMAFPTGAQAEAFRVGN